LELRWIITEESAGLHTIDHAAEAVINEATRRAVGSAFDKEKLHLHLVLKVQLILLLVATGLKEPYARRDWHLPLVSSI
jgi:hypothetical protein